MKKLEFKKTEFPFFYDECNKKFGYEKGNRISRIADKSLSQMKKEADYKDNKAIKKHMDINLLPTIAMYLAFIESGFTKDLAYKNTLEMAQIGARRVKKKNEKLGKIPFIFSLFRLFCSFVVKKSYPKEGWHIEWKRYDNNEIHFDMKRCIYMETTKKYNCPELCPVFCANDVTTFAGYAPNIIFKRKGTIGQGQEVCDFHFINGKL